MGSDFRTLAPARPMAAIEKMSTIASSRRDVEGERGKSPESCPYGLGRTEYGEYYDTSVSVNAAMEAAKLLENIPVLWEEADLTEKRKKLLMAMLDAVYVDIVEVKSVVAIRPKPAFRPIF